LNARLRKDVIVLNPVEQFREAPERVGLERFEHFGREDRYVKRLGVGIYESAQGSALEQKGDEAKKEEANRDSTDVTRQEDLKERRHEVIDPLHVPTRGVSYRPYVQHALETPLGRFRLPERHARPRPRHVDTDLVPQGAVETFDAA
jgi:hypothetical protein